jgi:poly-beta-hydroxyalkanoate depolymerase
MPYKIVEPVSEITMRGMKKYWGKRHTICQFLREIYPFITDEEAKIKAKIAMNMAKKMNDRLQHYKNLYNSKEKIDEELTEFFDDNMN